MSTKRRAYLTEMKTQLTLAVPALLAQIAMISMGFVDMVMTGRVLSLLHISETTPGKFIISPIPVTLGSSMSSSSSSAERTAPESSNGVAGTQEGRRCV